MILRDFRVRRRNFQWWFPVSKVTMDANALREVASTVLKLDPHETPPHSYRSASIGS